MSTAVAWIVEGTWQACVDAVRDRVPDTAEVVLLHVPDPEAPAAAHAAYAGLLGRGRPGRDPGTAVAHEAAASGERLLAEAAERLGRPCRRMQRTGRVEREVVAATEGADLLVVARDGDRTRPGPHSRFVVDHAPCAVLLVWPDAPPGTDTIPPPPGRAALGRAGPGHAGSGHAGPGPYEEGSSGPAHGPALRPPG